MGLPVRWFRARWRACRWLSRTPTPSGTGWLTGGVALSEVDSSPAGLVYFQNPEANGSGGFQQLPVCVIAPAGAARTLRVGV